MVNVFVYGLRNLCMTIHTVLYSWLFYRYLPWNYRGPSRADIARNTTPQKLNESNIIRCDNSEAVSTAVYCCRWLDYHTDTGVTTGINVHTVGIHIQYSYLLAELYEYVSTRMYFAICKLLLDSCSDWFQILLVVTDRAVECHYHSI